MKENRKGLGMGLDLLLKASSQKTPKNKEQGDLFLARGWHQQALEQEDKENSLEAYYYYRRIIDLWPQGLPVEEPDKVRLLSESFNNAATILFEFGNVASAEEYLEKALLVDEYNEIAKENLKIIQMGE